MHIAGHTVWSQEGYRVLDVALQASEGTVCGPTGQEVAHSLCAAAYHAFPEPDLRRKVPVCMRHPRWRMPGLVGECVCFLREFS